MDKIYTTIISPIEKTYNVSFPSFELISYSLSTFLIELTNHRLRGHKIVFTNGCFDLLHTGHIKLLEFAKKQGDIFVVGINSDNSIKQLKSDKRPIFKQNDRAILLSALEVVDYVIIFDELNPVNIIKKIIPNILIKGSDWIGNVIGQKYVEDNGGKVVLMPLIKGYSTTSIIDQILKKHRK